MVIASDNDMYLYFDYTVIFISGVAKTSTVRPPDVACKVYVNNGYSGEF